MEQTLVLSQVGLAGLMLATFFLYDRWAKKIGRFLHKMRVEPPIEKKATLVVGQQAPSFTGLDQAGRAYDSTTRIGQPVVRLFTMPTCPICRTITPKLGELRNRFPDVSIVVVTSEEGGSEAEGLTEDVTLLHSTSIRKQHAITSVPTLVMVNRENRVLAKERVSNFEDLAKRLELYLESSS